MYIDAENGIVLKLKIETRTLLYIIYASVY